MLRTDPGGAVLEAYGASSTGGRCGRWERRAVRRVGGAWRSAGSGAVGVSDGRGGTGRCRRSPRLRRRRPPWRAWRSPRSRPAWRAPRSLLPARSTGGPPRAVGRRWPLLAHATGRPGDGLLTQVIGPGTRLLAQMLPGLPRLRARVDPGCELIDARRQGRALGAQPLLDLLGAQRPGAGSPGAIGAGRACLLTAGHARPARARKTLTAATVAVTLRPARASPAAVTIPSEAGSPSRASSNRRVTRWPRVSVPGS